MKEQRPALRYYLFVTYARKVHTHIVKEVAMAVSNRQTQPFALSVQYTANIVMQISRTTMLYTSSQEQFLRLPVLTFWHNKCRQCSLLRCYTVWLGKHSPMPRRIVVPPLLGSSSPYSSSLLGLTVPEHQETSRNKNPMKRRERFTQ